MVLVGQEVAVDGALLVESLVNTRATTRRQHRQVGVYFEGWLEG